MFFHAFLAYALTNCFGNYFNRIHHHCVYPIYISKLQQQMTASIFLVYKDIVIDILK